MPNVSYSIILGYLQAAAITHEVIRQEYAFHKHIIYQIPDIDAMEAELLGTIRSPSILALSIYFWNRAPTLELARRVKERWPSCTIIIGGNDVSSQAEHVFAEAPWVDILVNGEGEVIFRNVLLALLEPQYDLGTIRGLSFRRGGEIVTTEPEPRIMDLEEIPSPLLSGVYDTDAITRSRVIIYETNRGCPFHCAFCFWGGATNSRVRQFSIERIKTELEYIVQHASPNTTLFLADANFGMLPRDLVIAEWLVELLHKYDKRLFMFANWAKNTNDKVVKTAQVLFNNHLVAAVTLSAQSFDPDVLKIAHRANIAPTYYKNLQQTFQSLGIPTYTELIWGLPGESVASFLDGVEYVISSGGSPVIYPLLLLNNTEYTEPAFRSRHQIITKFLPYQINNLDMKAEFLIGHASMSTDDWLYGLGLRLSISLFYNTLLRGLLWFLHRTTGARFVDMCAILHEYIASPECVLEKVNRLYANYMTCWLAPEKLDHAEVFQEISNQGIMEHVHYQAMVHHILADEDRTVRFLEDAASRLYQALPNNRTSRAMYEAVLEFQIALLKGLRSIVHAEPITFEVEVASEVADLLVETGQLSLPESRPTNGQIRLSLSVDATTASSPFDTSILAMYHGSLHPFKLFNAISVEPTTEPTRV
jgi:radical SAM superfamily enzyme YgiQ (UPF0313 family)